MRKFTSLSLVTLLAVTTAAAASITPQTVKSWGSLSSKQKVLYVESKITYAFNHGLACIPKTKLVRMRIFNNVMAGINLRAQGISWTRLQVTHAHTISYNTTQILDIHILTTQLNQNFGSIIIQVTAILYAC